MKEASVQRPVWTKNSARCVSRSAKSRVGQGWAPRLASSSLSDQSSPSALCGFPCSKLLGLPLDTVVEALTPSQLNIPTPTQGARNTMINIQQLLPSGSSLLSK